MSADITIRALTEKDLVGVGELLQTRDDLAPHEAEKRLEMLEWIAFHNPFANDEPTYFVADDNGKIIAHLGRMPMLFVINGQPCKGYFTHDLFVHPEYRAQGQGIFITLSLYRAIEENSDSFCCMVWTTELNLRFQKRLGYYCLNSNRYYKFFNPYGKMKKVIKRDSLAKLTSLICQSLLRPLDTILINLCPSGVKVAEVDTFDSRFDNLGPATFQNIGICSLKTRKYLNWRFTSKPYNNMKVLVAEESDKVLGFAVVGVKIKDGNPEGVLVDIMAEPLDTRTISSLFKSAVNYFRRKKVHYISCCLSDRRLAKIANRFLFIKDFMKTEPIMLANLDKFDGAEVLTDITKWHLTYGASDFLMLEMLPSTDSDGI